MNASCPVFDCSGKKINSIILFLGVSEEESQIFTGAGEGQGRIQAGVPNWYWLATKPGSSGKCFNHTHYPTVSNPAQRFQEKGLRSREVGTYSRGYDEWALRVTWRPWGVRVGFIFAFMW